MCHDLCFQDRNNNQGWGESRAKSRENDFQKQPSGDVLSKRCSENMQQIYRRTPMPKCYFNKVAKQLGHLGH